MERVITMLHKLIMDIPSYITKEIKALDLGIEAPERNEDIEILLKNTVLQGGKRLRPLLCFLVADLFGVTCDEINPYARAIELVHAASLTHDDVVDNATLRRGRPSINVASSNKKAVLVGDYLLADVIVSLSKRGNVKLVTEMAKIIKDLAEGEWLQLQMSEDKNYTKERITQIAKLKTASVMSWCTISPAILANASDDLVTLSRSFGNNLGMAFQLIDDAMDFRSAVEADKDNNLDFANGIINSVVYELFINSQTLFKQYKSGETLNLFNYESELMAAVKTIRLNAKTYIDTAEQELRQIFEIVKGNEKTLRPLLQILNFLAKRGQ